LIMCLIWTPDPSTTLPRIPTGPPLSLPLNTTHILEGVHGDNDLIGYR
jgi:hypothetical protein